MRVSILCSNPDHPVNDYLFDWVKRQSQFHQIELIRSKSLLSGGDLLFLVSCSEILNTKDREAYGASLVLHASDLPRGRGWSPHIWELANGASLITVSLLEASDKVDTGQIWKKKKIPVPSTALWDEINHLLFEAEMKLMDFALDAFGHIKAEPQSADEIPTYYNQRKPENSRIDPQKTIADQFDLIRVCDPNRFPAFFDHKGKRFVLKLERLNEK